ncbi:MAG: alpha/beta hydrolase [Actinomycetota bacterium]
MQESTVIGADGVRLAVRIFAGQDSGVPTAVLHHGLASSQHIWDLMVPALSRTFRVVTFDARGHGRSGKPGAGYGFDHTVADTLAVLRATRARRPVLVGHSWGAMVALELAARHPRALGGVVLVDGGITRMRDGFSSWPEARAALSPPHLAGTPVAEFRAMIPMFFGDAVEVTPEVEDIVLAVMRVGADGTIRPRLRRANHLRILRAIWDQDTHALHTRLRTPALAILARGGDAEWDARRREAVTTLRAAGSPTRTAWLDGIHDLPLQHPNALARRIAAFARTAVR